MAGFSLSHDRLMLGWWLSVLVVGQGDFTSVSQRPCPVAAVEPEVWW